MQISEVRVKLVQGRTDRLKAFCSVTFDNMFVVRDIKVIEGTDGYFVAMPSGKLTDRCPSCGSKNNLRSKFCTECGDRGLGTRRVGYGTSRVGRSFMRTWRIRSIRRLGITCRVRSWRRLRRSWSWRSSRGIGRRVWTSMTKIITRIGIIRRRVRGAGRRGGRSLRARGGTRGRGGGRNRPRRRLGGQRKIGGGRRGGRGEAGAGKRRRAWVVRGGDLLRSRLAVM